ncbi:LuxR family transcriptional regulator [Caulobacter sp. CCG-8]|uniref:helix-turn-helix transcriptional regulator n=1 Tax=Caulobacter sp. CCG-8 TaxID=3127958 RepID=UPI00307E71E0
MLNTAEQEAWSFLSKAPHYAGPDEVEAHFGRAIAAFGYDRFCATLINAEQLGREPPTLSRRDFDAWDARYWGERHVVHDPCIKLLQKSTRAFAWTDAKPLGDNRARAMWGEASEFGMNDGYVVRVFGPAGHEVLIRMATAAPDTDPTARAVVESLATVFGTIMLKHWELQDEPSETWPDYAVISERQAQCLYWASRGKTDWEIGAILTLSPRTVHHHIEAAKKRLGVVKRQEAVMKAGELGLLAKVV